MRSCSSNTITDGHLRQRIRQVVICEGCQCDQITCLEELSPCGKQGVGSAVCSEDWSLAVSCVESLRRASKDFAEAVGLD